MDKRNERSLQKQGKKTKSTKKKSTPLTAKYTEEDMKEAIMLIQSGSLSKISASKLYNIPRPTLQDRVKKLGINQKLSKKTLNSKIEKKKNVNYSEEILQEAIKLIKKGTLSKNRASKLYKIPRQTLQYRLGSRFKKQRKGPCTVLNEEEEDLLVKWMLDCSKRGFPKRKLNLVSSVEELLKENPERKTPFKLGKPGKSWVMCFIGRHPEISFKSPEPDASDDTNDSSQEVKQWFSSIEQYLLEKGLFHILIHPDRVFNGDETDFQLCPQTGKDVTLEGADNASEDESEQPKCVVTVMFSFSAAGDTVPPMIIYPYVRQPQEIALSVPENWGMGGSETGRMNSENFFDYMTNVFIPFLKRKKIPRPVILFLNGRKTPLTFHLSNICEKEGVILIALYPNATRVLKPADLALFRPIREGWKDAVANWRRQNPGSDITKELVAPLLKKVVNEHIWPKTLKWGFSACGLHPWNVGAIDFNKSFGQSENIENKLKIYQIQVYRDEAEEIERRKHREERKVLNENMKKKAIPKFTEEQTVASLVHSPIIVHLTQNS